MGNGNKINIWVLFIAGSVLSAAGWFMKPFPIFIFVSLAPFFAILDYTLESENFWEHLELILIGLFVFFFSALGLETSSLIKAIFLAILFSLPFAGFAFVYEQLGPRTGKFIIVIFWLALEYVMLSLKWPNQPIYTADALLGVPYWYRWNIETGYLGITAWILLVNWIVYSSALRGRLNWSLISIGVVFIIIPIVFSMYQEGKPVLRNSMIELYKGQTVSTSAYPEKGELVARTCAWLSILILLFAFVKSGIKKP